jgi:hypothetical protein
MQLLQRNKLLPERVRRRLGHVPERRAVLVCLRQQSEVEMLRLDKPHGRPLYLHNRRWPLLLVRYPGRAASSSQRFAGPVRAALIVGGLTVAIAASAPAVHAILLLALLLLSACLVAIAQQTLP